MSVTVIILVLIIVTLLVRKYFENKRFNELFYKLPGPPGMPVLGHLEIFSNLKDFDTIVKKTLEDYDGIVPFRVGPWYKTIFVSDARFIALLCKSNQIGKAEIYRIFVNWLGINIFTAENKLWKRYRDLLIQAFHNDVLQRYIIPFHSTAHSLINMLKDKVGKPMDMHKLIELWAVDTVTETSLGVSINAQKCPESDYLHYLLVILKVLDNRLHFPLRKIDFFYWFTADFWKERAAIKYLRGYTNFILTEKIKTRSLKNQDSIDDKKVKKMAFLDLLLERRGIDINDKEICDHVQAILFAGTDTASVTVGCTLCLLSKHPEIQEKAFAEIRSICGDEKSKQCTIADLQQMTYLEMVIKETLRMYPPPYFLGKRTLEEIEFNGYTLPKGIDIAIVVNALHTREKYFPNPNKFDPERFNPKNQETLVPYSYVPFGAGPRSCLGQKLAFLQMKVVVSMVLRNFKLLPVDGFQLKLVGRVIQKPDSNGFQMILQDREY